MKKTKVFGQTVNPISTRGAEYTRHSTTSPPGISDLATGLPGKTKVLPTTEPLDPMCSGVRYATKLSLKSLSFQKLHFVSCCQLTRPYHKNWHANLKSNMQHLHYIRIKYFL